MTSAVDLLGDAFGRVRDNVHEAVDGMSDDDLAVRLDAEANSIAWLVWHLARVQDDHVAGLAGSEQVWTADGWVGRFALPFDATSIGYGHSASEAGQVRASADLLAGYADAVIDRTLVYLGTLSDDDLDVVIDEAWDPPVTRAIRLVSVVDDDAQHSGQAVFVRGILERR